MIETAAPGNEAGRRFAGVSPARLLVAFSVLLVVAIVAAAAFALWQMREESLKNAERELANLNHVLAEQTARAAHSVDQVLKATQEWFLATTPAQKADGAAMHATLRARIDGLPQVGVLMIVGADGRIEHSTRSHPPPAVSIADLPYFVEHRDSPRVGLLINPPRKSRVDGKWSIYFTRGIRDPDGRFLGLVSALVDPAYFQEFYRKISLGEGSAVALMRSDGILLTRHPLREDWMGRSFAHGDVYKHILSKAGRGVVRTHSVVDDVDRIISGQLLADMPLAVNVSMTQEAALAEWRRWVALISISAATAAAVLVGLVILIWAEVRRRERIARDLLTSESQLREAQRIASLGSWSYDFATDRFEWSEQARRLFGWPDIMPPAAGRAGFLDLVREADRKRAEEILLQPRTERGKGAASDTELAMRHRNGELRWMRLAAMPVRGQDGRVVRIEGTVMDVTERRAAEERLRLAASVFERSSEANMVVDRDGRIISVNQAFTRITGYTEAEAVGSNPRFISSGRHPPEYYREMWEALREVGHWEGEIWNRRKNGEVFPERMSIEAARDAQGEVTHYIAVFSDISERKAAEDRIKNLAYYDPLTSLPNRSLLRDRVDQALASAHRGSRKLALLFLDLDRFKNINDSLGHHAGDLVLQSVAERLLHGIREVDTVARHGGDEFVVVLPDADTEGAARVARKIIDTLSAPLVVMGRELAATPSIGIAMYPTDGIDAETLIMNADAAMYHAKANGRANYQFFAKEMNARAFEALAMEGSLRRAVERQEFFLLYQPQVDAATGVVVGAEALVRWRHPSLGTVLPDRFIATAEETGLIAAIGEWVLGEACRQQRAWQDEGLPGVCVAVNLSATQFRQRDFGETVRRVLAESGMDPRCLELEVTERVIMRDADGVVGMLRELKALGLKLAVDDFGTGYSSLSYLKQFPLDKLKIDKSFVRNLMTDPNDVAIIRSIIGLGRHFNLTVIAEGVESREQCEFLKAAGCHEIQGHCISLPLPPEQFADLLRQQATRHADGPCASEAAQSAPNPA